MNRVKNYTVIDLEMTGLAAKDNKIIEIGAVRVRDGQMVDTYGMLVNPHCPIEPMVVKLTGITDEMLTEGMEEDPAMAGLLEFIGKDVIVGHNVSFDYSFIKQWAVNKRRALEVEACDTLKMARGLLPEDQKKKLEALCSYFQIERIHAHRALDDAIETWQVYERLADMAEEAGKQELLEPKPLKIKMKRQTPATAHQIEQLKEFMQSHGITETIDWENLTRSQASRKMDAYRVRFGEQTRRKKKKHTGREKSSPSKKPSEKLA